MKKLSFLAVALLSGLAQAASLDRSAVLDLRLKSLSLPILGTMAPSPFDDAALQAMPGLPMAAAIAAQNQAAQQAAAKNSALARVELTAQQIKVDGGQADRSINDLYDQNKLSAIGFSDGPVNIRKILRGVNKVPQPRVSLLPLMDIGERGGVIRLRYDRYNGGSDNVYVSYRAGKKPTWSLAAYGGHSFSAQGLKDLRKSLRAEMAKLITAIDGLGTISSSPSDRKQLARMYLAQHKMLAQILTGAK